MAKNEETFELLGGYLDPKTNEVIKEVTIREMNGTDEETLSNPQIRTSGVKIIRTILNRCLLSVGNIKRTETSQTAWNELLDNMLSNDQDTILFKIRQATYGDDISFPTKCPLCDGDLIIDAKLSELEVSPFNSYSFPFSLPRGIERDGVTYTEGMLHHPLAKDRDALAEIFDKNPGKAKTEMIGRCIENFSVPLNMDDIRSMSMRDREYLSKLLTDNSFGTKTFIDVECIHCGKEVQVSLGQTNFI